MDGETMMLAAENSLISLSEIVRGSIAILLRGGMHVENEIERYIEGERFPSGEHTVQFHVEFPFDRSQRTLYLDDYIDRILKPRMMLLLARIPCLVKSTIELPLPPEGAAARHSYDGISMRGMILSEILRDRDSEPLLHNGVVVTEQIARLDIAYRKAA